MRKIIFAIAVVVAVILISCQKEIDWGLGTSPNVAQTLVRIKTRTGTDTTQVDYTYDANKRIIREKTSGMGSGINLDNDLLINRNASGIITTTVQKAAALVAAGIDSVVTRFNYDAATSKYTSSVFDLGIPGFAVTDSAVYAYDASGRITSDAHYLSIAGFPLPPMLILKNSYTYGGINLVMVKQDAATTPGDPLSPVSSQTYTFDTKANPLVILNEAVLLSRPGLYSANNATKAVVANIPDPTQDFTMDYTYSYFITTKPDSSIGTRTPGGQVTIAKYYYQ